MGWPEVSIEDFPPKRDDEPASLRRDIIDELTDHFACAFNRELLKNPNEQLARIRVLKQFGDPVKIARQLWLDAMKEKIMSQRIMTGISAAMAVCCILVVGIAWVMMKESHVVNHQMLEQLAVIADRPQADSTVVKSLQRTNEAIVRELRILAESQRPARQSGGMSGAMEGAAGLTGMGSGFGAKPAEPSNINQQILNQLEQLNQKSNQQGRSNSEAMNQISFQLVQDKEDGKPAVGFTGRLTKNRNRNDSFTLDAVSDKSGTLDFGKLPWGSYDLSLRAPWGDECFVSSITALPGRDYFQTIDCPAAAPKSVPVQFQVNWTDKLISEDWLLLCDFRHPGNAGGLNYHSRTIGDFYWGWSSLALGGEGQPRVYLIDKNNKVCICPLGQHGEYKDLNSDSLVVKASINILEGERYSLPVIYLIKKHDLKKLSVLNSSKSYQVILIKNKKASIISFDPSKNKPQGFGGAGGSIKEDPYLPYSSILLPFKKIVSAPVDNESILSELPSLTQTTNGVLLPNQLTFSALNGHPNVWEINIPDLFPITPESGSLNSGL